MISGRWKNGNIRRGRRFTTRTITITATITIKNYQPIRSNSSKIRNSLYSSSSRITITTTTMITIITTTTTTITTIITTTK